MFLPVRNSKSVKLSYGAGVNYFKIREKQLLQCINNEVYLQACPQSTEKSSEEKCYQLVIVGGGIVGLATAQELKNRKPKLCIGLVEKEQELATHQSGHNSGVVHAGVYYKPGSLRAKLCVEGLKKSYEYFDKHKIPYKKCGKLIVATDIEQVSRLHDLHKRAIKNGVPDARLICGDEIPQIEPYCKGLQAIHSPHTGIVDWAVVARKYGSEFKKKGGDIHLGFRVISIEETTEGYGPGKTVSDFPIVIEGSEGERIRTAYLLTCGGLYSDDLASMTGGPLEPKIIPFRGEYLVLNKDKEYLCKGNIYPVPDPRFPFLGVHYTPRMDGSIWLGPNAMLAFGKESYRFSQVNFEELCDIVNYKGFQRFLLKHVSAAVEEVKKSFFLSYQVAELKKFIPEVEKKDIKRGPSGVRAQAMSLYGELVEDFVFSGEGRILHCRNAPSPGATSSLAIGRMLADKIEKEFSI